MPEARPAFIRFKSNPDDPRVYVCQEGQCQQEVRKQDAYWHALETHGSPNVYVESPPVEPVHYKLVLPGEPNDILKFRCTLCQDIRDSGELAFHASMRHGTGQYTVDTSLLRDRE
jgi:hypothetical protein